MSASYDTVIAHSAPSPEDPTVQAGKSRGLFKKMLHNGIDTSVRFLQSLRVGKGTGLSGYDTQDGAIMANGSAARVMMGDQVFPNSDAYAQWRYNNSILYLDSKAQTAMYQINTSASVLSTLMQKSLRVGSTTGLAGFDGQDGAIMANGGLAALWTGDQNAPTAQNWGRWRYASNVMNLDTQAGNSVLAINGSTFASQLKYALRVGTGTAVDAALAADGIIAAAGASGCIILADRATPNTTNAWAHMFYTSGIWHLYSQAGVDVQNWTFSNGSSRILKSLRLGTGTAYAGNDGQDGILTVSGPNGAVYIGSTANDGWAGYWRCISTGLYLFRHDGVEIGRWDLQNARLGVGGIAPRAALDVNGDIISSNQARNTHYWGTNGVAPPGASSTGIKLSLYGTIGAMAATDYGLGIESGQMWLNSGGGWKFYSASTLVAWLGATGVLLTDQANQRGDGVMNLYMGSSNTEGIGSNRISGSANSDANVNGIDFYTAGVKRVRILNNGLTRFGFTSAATGTHPYPSSLVGMYGGSVGSTLGNEVYPLSLYGTHSNNDVFSMSLDNVIGGGSTWNYYSWILGRSVDGGLRNVSAYMAFGPSGVGIAVGNPSFTLHVGGTGGFSGALTKAGGGFLIDHPLDPDNKDLYHGFVEAPRSDLLYRGMVQLDKGEATINIDTDCVRPGAQSMTQGTFTALTRDAMIASLQNQSSNRYVYPTGPIVDGQFSIRCDQAETDDWVAWVVIAERNDPWTISTENPHQDGKGNMVLEREKPDPPPGIMAVLNEPIITEQEADEDAPDIEQWEDAGLKGTRGYPRHPEAIGRTMAKRKRIVRTVKRRAT